MDASPCGFDSRSRHHTSQAVIAGWSSPVARRAHNPKVTGSNPVPATNFFGGVAQLVRARGSYPRCHWFDSSHRHQPRTSISRKQPGISVSAIPGCFVLSGQHAVRLAEGAEQSGEGFRGGHRADRRQKRTSGSTARKRREGARGRARPRRDALGLIKQVAGMTPG